MKVAVPVSDEKLEVVERTGQASFFAVFEISEDKNFNFLELREIPEAHEHNEIGRGQGGEGQGFGNGRGAGEGRGLHSHDHDHDNLSDEEHTEGHNRQSAIINDCEYALLKRVGPHMREALENADIKIKLFRRKDGDNAKDYVTKFVTEIL
jgi:predicted Fe-Mo cluster-binding NifX family protein